MAGFIYDALVIYKVYKLQDNIDFGILCYTQPIATLAPAP